MTIARYGVLRPPGLLWSRDVIQTAGPKLAMYSTGSINVTTTQNRHDRPASQSSGPRRFVGRSSMPGASEGVGCSAERHLSHRACGRRKDLSAIGAPHRLHGTVGSSSRSATGSSMPAVYCGGRGKSGRIVWSFSGIFDGPCRIAMVHSAHNTEDECRCNGCCEERRECGAREHRDQYPHDPDGGGHEHEQYPHANRNGLAVVHAPDHTPAGGGRERREQKRQRPMIGILRVSRQR